jgi:hypothetical protein
MLLFTAKTQKEFERILDDPSKSQALSDDEKNALNAALTELKKQAEEKEIAQNTPNLDSKAINQKKAKAADSAPTSPKHGGAVNKKIIETIQGLATNSATCKELEASFQANKVKLTQALDKLIEHPVAGKTLKDFCLNGAEVADFLPKICNEKGLKAVASYAENRSTLNLINIFYQTNTLGFAISHFAKSILKPKEQEKPITLEEKAEKLKSFSEKIRQKKKTYVEQVQDRKSAPQIGLTQ